MMFDDTVYDTATVSGSWLIIEQALVSLADPQTNLIINSVKDVTHLGST